jgi:Raf kinase inhibitor-like YbhB/YbcL family protein
MNFELTSTTFEDGQHIPIDYTRDGRNISPSLKWSDPPAGTQSLALVCEDPDAPNGTWCHWVVFNIPAESRELGEDFPREPIVPNGTTQGKNDFGNIGYDGPAPPPDASHRYFFRLYALSRPLELQAGVEREPFLKAVKGHVRAEAPLMGTYGRGEVHEIPDDPIKKKAQQDRASFYTAPLS